MLRSQNWFVMFLLVGLFVLIIALANGFLSTDTFLPVVISHKHEYHFEKISSYLSAVMESINQILSMLLTIEFSLFVLVGFAAQKQISTGERLGALQILLGVAFIVFSFISIYFGYIARIQVYELVNAANLEFKSLRAIIGRQALFVSIAGICAICIAVSTFLNSARIGRSSPTYHQKISSNSTTKDSKDSKSTSPTGVLTVGTTENRTETTSLSKTLQEPTLAPDPKGMRNGI